MDRRQQLAAYIQEISLETDFWGRSNCMLFPARWVGLVRPDYDPSPWIGVHQSMRDAVRDIRKAGGMISMFEREAEKAGLEEIAPADAELGDVGLFKVSAADAEAFGITIFDVAPAGQLALYPGCIRTDRHWAVRGADGVGRVLAERSKPIRAWRV